MSRIRTVKPEFFTSESLASVSIAAQRTFIGLWCEADDAGNGVANARVLHGALWVLSEEVTPADVERHLEELEATDHIALYEVDGKRYYTVRRFDEHQAEAYRRGKPKHPSPDAGFFTRGNEKTRADSDPPEHARHDSGATRDFSREEMQESAGTGTGKGNGEGEAVLPGRATRAPKDFPITERMRTWAGEKQITANLEDETEKFLDYHRSKGTTFKDWTAAWQTWMRNAKKWNPTPERKVDAKTGLIKEGSW